MVDTTLSEPRVPPSLLQTCLQFVACNLQLVDSLVGFPEIMGQRLFLEAIKRRQFEPLSQTNDSFWNLKLFQDAYGALVLEKLQLKGKRHALFKQNFQANSVSGRTNSSAVSRKNQLSNPVQLFSMVLLEKSWNLRLAFKSHWIWCWPGKNVILPGKVIQNQWNSLKNISLKKFNIFSHIFKFCGF